MDIQEVPGMCLGLWLELFHLKSSARTDDHQTSVHYSARTCHLYDNVLDPTSSARCENIHLRRGLHLPSQFACHELS